jgi:peroxiredoxin
MLALGTPAPDFSLPDVSTGRPVSLSDFASEKAVLVMFICTHCPYVVHVQEELARLADDYAGKGVTFVGITSNDVAQYPQDAPEPTARMAHDAGFNFPVLYDQSQDVARAFTAACTPDFFLFGPNRKLAYRGQLDSSRPQRGTADGRDLRAALDAVLAAQPVNPEQIPSMGCGIKWRAA